MCRQLIAGAALLAGLTLGCARSPGAAAPSHKKPPSQAELGRVTLTEAAETRLGIPAGLTEVQWRRRASRRLIGGEVMPVPGHAAQVVAPQAGTVQAPAGQAWPVAGSAVRAGQTLADLSPILGASESIQVSAALVESEAAVARAVAQDEAAELALRRAEAMLSDQVVGSKAVEEARAGREVARAALGAARAQRQQLTAPSGRAGLMRPLRIDAPIGGVLREVRVAPRQQVTVGAALFEIASDDLRWVRVAVPSGELRAMNPAGEALVGDLSAAAEQPLVRAPPAHPAPNTAQPLQGTVDRYFVVSDASRFQLGQRVAVWLELSGDEECPVIPAAAIVYDPAGSAWVYESTAPRVFERRRVEVIRTESALAILSPRSFLKNGVRRNGTVVTAGAMELYGSEFGGK